MNESAEIKIELTSKGKTIAVLTGTSAEIVDRAVTQALVMIAKEETKEKVMVKEQIGDNFVLIQKIKERNWTDQNLPEGFSYSETILLIIKEMEDKVILKRQEKIDYLRKRLVELRRQARPKTGGEKATA